MPGGIGAMLRNVLDALGSDTLRHVALVTGTKHYIWDLSKFSGKGAQRRLSAKHGRACRSKTSITLQEDILFEAAARGRFTWSVHRPHTVIGYAVGDV